MFQASCFRVERKGKEMNRDGQRKKETSQSETHLACLTDLGCPACYSILFYSNSPPSSANNCAKVVPFLTSLNSPSLFFMTIGGLVWQWNGILKTTEYAPTL